MEGKGVTEAAERQAGPRTEGARAPRRRRNGNDPNLSYFLIKPGSSPAKPELGQEVQAKERRRSRHSENGQPFYTVTAWKAVPEVNARKSCDRENRLSLRKRLRTTSNGISTSSSQVTIDVDWSFERPAA